jgi:hypothetical protein
MKVFNTRALTRKQRFTKALLTGGACAAAAIIILYILFNVFGLYMSLLYVAVGFGIGMAIQYFGRGVQIQFSLLAAGLTLAVIVIVDLLTIGLDNAMAYLTQFGLDSLWEIGYRAAAIYLAYRYSRVV